MGGVNMPTTSNFLLTVNMHWFTGVYMEVKSYTCYYSMIMKFNALMNLHIDLCSQPILQKLVAVAC